MFSCKQVPCREETEALSSVFREIDSEDFLKSLRSSNGKKNEAFKKYVTVIHKPLLDYVGKFINSPELAQKLVREVFVDFHRGLAEFKRHCSLSSWAFMLANARIEACLADSFPGKQVPDERLTGRKADVTELAENLPFSLKPAYLLHDLQGLALGEVSAILGLTEKAVRNRVHMARHQIVSWVKSQPE